jgi:intracellular multiplication protein IcmL
LDSQSKIPDEALVIVKNRNDFYRDNYRKVVGMLLFSVLIMTILVGGLIYLITNPPQPRYFATTTDGRISPLVPLDQPNISQAALLQWANTAAISAYTYNFVNYRQALQDAQAYFTPDGWSAFMGALNSSNNLTAVIAKKLVVSAVATGAPVILQQGILGGIYAWRVQMPMLITYQSASQFSRQSIIVTMLVTRVSTLNSPQGIGIAQFVAAGTSTP